MLLTTNELDQTIHDALLPEHCYDCPFYQKTSIMNFGKCTKHNKIVSGSNLNC